MRCYRGYCYSVRRPELGQLWVQSYSQSPHCPCVSLCGDLSLSLRSFVATDHKDVSEKVTFCRSRDKSSQSSLARPYLSTAISSVSSLVLSALWWLLNAKRLSLSIPFTCCVRQVKVNRSFLHDLTWLTLLISYLVFRRQFLLSLMHTEGNRQSICTFTEPLGPFSPLNTTC